MKIGIINKSFERKEQMCVNDPVKKRIKVAVYCVFIVVYFVFFLTRPFIGDDKAYSIHIDFSTLSSIFAFYKSQYYSFSSREIINTFSIFFAQKPHFIWAFVTSCVFALTGYTIVSMFTKRRLEDHIIVLSLLTFYPIVHMESAGWIATTTTYLYPLCFGLVALKAISDTENNIQINPFKKVLYSLALLYACNQEQMVLIVSAFYWLYIGYRLFTQKKISWYVVFNGILALCSLIFIYTCPGNYARSSSNIYTYYPEYIKFNGFQKLFLGIATAISETFNYEHLLIFIATAIIAYSSFKTNNKWYLKQIAFIPFILLGIVYFFPFVLPGHFTIVNLIPRVMEIYRAPQPSIPLNKDTIIIIAISILFYGCILVGVSNAFDKDEKKKKILCILILLAGICSRVMMGFSPTVFASGMRTYIYYYFSYILVFAIVYTYLFNKNELHELVLLNGFILFGILSVLSIRWFD